MDLITRLIALSTLVYSCHDRSVSIWLNTIPKISISIVAVSGIIIVGPTFTGTTNGSVLRRLYVAGGDIKTIKTKVLFPKSLCTNVTHTLR